MSFTTDFLKQRRQAVDSGGGSDGSFTPISSSSSSSNTATSRFLQERRNEVNNRQQTGASLPPLIPPQQNLIVEPEEESFFDRISKNALDRATDDLVNKIFRDKNEGKDTSKLQERLIKVTEAKELDDSSFKKKKVAFFEGLNRAGKQVQSGLGNFGASLLDVVSRFSEADAELIKQQAEAIDDPELKKSFLKSFAPVDEKGENIIVTRDISKDLKQWSAETSVTNPTFMDKVVAGTGSMLGFIATNVITKGSTLAPVLLESLTESASVYEELRAEGMDIGDASIRADADFVGNLIVNKMLNVFDINAKDIGLIKKTISGVTAEGLQEGLQQLMSNGATGKPIMEGVLESMGIGAILGGTTTLILPSGEVVSITPETNIPGDPDTKDTQTLTSKVSTEATNSLQNKDVGQKEGSLDRAREDIKAGKTLDPVEIRRTPEGDVVVVDGRHRLEASRESGVEIEFVDVTKQFDKNAEGDLVEELSKELEKKIDTKVEEVEKEEAEKEALEKTKEEIEEQKGEVKEPEATELDEEKETFDFSSTQLDLPEAVSKQIIDFGNKIPDSELHTEDGDRSFGREQEPHVTTLFGLETENEADVRKVVEGFGPVEVELGEVSIFENDDFDVVKAEIKGDQLVELNKKLDEQLDTPGKTFDKFEPHATIAYVKKGEGKKYVGDKSLVGQKITMSELTFSSKSGDKTVIKLDGTKPLEGDLKKRKAELEKKVAPIESFTEGKDREFSFDPDSTKNEGRFNLQPAGKFDKFFREKTDTEGVSLVIGVEKDGTNVTQAIRFDKSKFTEAQAKEWFDENKGKFEFGTKDESAKKPVQKPTPKKPAPKKPPVKKVVAQPVEQTAKPAKKPKTKDGKIPEGFKKSRVIERVADTLRSEVDLNETIYKTLTLDNIAEQAIDIVNKQPELAEDIISGYAIVPEGTTKAGVMIASAEQSRKAGDFKNQKDLIIQRSFMQTRHGQEIVTERLVTDLSSDRFIRDVIKVRMDKVIKKVKKDISRGKAFTDKVTSNAKSATRKVNVKVLSKIESAQKILDDLIC